MKNSPKNLNLLVLYDPENIEDYGKNNLEAFRKASKFSVYFMPFDKNLESTFNLSLFDVIVLHFSLEKIFNSASLLPFGNSLKEFGGYKLSFIDTKDDLKNMIAKNIREFGVHDTFMYKELEHNPAIFTELDSFIDANVKKGQEICLISSVIGFMSSDTSDVKIAGRESKGFAHMPSQNIFKRKNKWVISSELENPNFMASEEYMKSMQLTVGKRTRNALYRMIKIVLPNFLFHSLQKIRANLKENL